MGMACAQAQHSDRLSQDATSRPSPGGLARASPAIQALNAASTPCHSARAAFALSSRVVELEECTDTATAAADSMVTMSSTMIATGSANPLCVTSLFLTAR